MPKRPKMGKNQLGNASRKKRRGKNSLKKKKNSKKEEKVGSHKGK